MRNALEPEFWFEKGRRERLDAYSVLPLVHW